MSAGGPAASVSAFAEEERVPAESAGGDGGDVGEEQPDEGDGAEGDEEEEVEEEAVQDLKDLVEGQGTAAEAVNSTGASRKEWLQWESTVVGEGKKKKKEKKLQNEEQVAAAKTFLGESLEIKAPDAMQMAPRKRKPSIKDQVRAEENRRKAKQNATAGAIQRAALAFVELDEVFHGVGEEAGVVDMWRVEGFELVDWYQHGIFYKRDSYIVLRTDVDNLGRLTWDIFILHGEQTTAEKKFIVALKVVELRRHLNGAAVVHRERAEEESDIFISCFHQVEVLQYPDGGSACALNHIDPEGNVHQPSILLQLKGKQFIRVLVVPCSSSSLNSGDVFVLYDYAHVFLWVGRECNHEEREAAMRLAMEIKGWQTHSGPLWGNNVATLETLHEGSETNDFWALLKEGEELAIIKAEMMMDDEGDEGDEDCELEQTEYQSDARASEDEDQEGGTAAVEATWVAREGETETDTALIQTSAVSTETVPVSTVVTLAPAPAAGPVVSYTQTNAAGEAVVPVVFYETVAVPVIQPAEAGGDDDEASREAQKCPKLTLFHLAELAQGVVEPEDLEDFAFCYAPNNAPLLSTHYFETEEEEKERRRRLFARDVVASERVIEEAIGNALARLRAENQRMVASRISSATVREDSKKVRVFKVTAKGLVPVPAEFSGIFSPSHNYVVLFSYNRGRSSKTARMVIYLWKSPQAPVLPLMRWEMQIRKSLEATIYETTRAVPLYVVAERGKEPQHFLNLFPLGLIILLPDPPKLTPPASLQKKGKGKKKKGKRKIIATRPAYTKQVQMFRVSGFFADADPKQKKRKKGWQPPPDEKKKPEEAARPLFCSAMEVEPRMRQLVSSCCFLINKGKALYVWCGRFCSEAERAAADHMAGRLLDISASKLTVSTKSKKKMKRQEQMFRQATRKAKQTIKGTVPHKAGVGSSQDRPRRKGFDAN